MLQLPALCCRLAAVGCRECECGRRSGERSPDSDGADLRWGRRTKPALPSGRLIPTALAVTPISTAETAPAVSITGDATEDVHSTGRCGLDGAARRLLDEDRRATGGGCE